MKKTIMLFAGTTEGRRICEFLAVKKCITHVYVTTEYGKDLLPEQNNVHIHVGKMDEGQRIITRKLLTAHYLRRSKVTMYLMRKSIWQIWKAEGKSISLLLTLLL